MQTRSLIRSLTLPAGRAIAKVRRRLRMFFRGESPRFFFDLDDRERISRIMAEHGLTPPPGSPRESAYRLGHPTRGEKLYELRDDLRREIPLALTPAQRGDYFRWFCRFGWSDMDIEPLDLLRTLFELDAAPDRGLVASYLVQPAWQQKYPQALTSAGWNEFKCGIVADYGIRGRWLRRAGLPLRYAQAQAGSPSQLAVNAIGLFRYTSGLQQAAQSVVDALRVAGVSVSVRDVPMAHNRDGRGRAGFDGLECYPITILNTGLDMPVREVYRLAGLHARPGVYRIAVWWWELEQLPPDWLERGGEVNEIWAPTSFIARALAVLGKPVHPMLPSVRLPAFAAKPKAAFGLAPEKFTFLFVFDMNSRMPRKNPLGLIEAFRLAFRRSEPVELAIKVSPQERFYSDWWRELRRACRDNQVTLIDRGLERSDLLALMNAADAYVSLHRSEGFGLTMAEAMLLGKPTIATGYSGNRDFMTPDNSFLVDYQPTVIVDDMPPYPKGCVWAEASTEHAASLMRRVYEGRDEAGRIAARGKADAEAILSPEAAAQRLVTRLAEIRRS